MNNEYLIDYSLFIGYKCSPEAIIKVKTVKHGREL